MPKLLFQHYTFLWILSIFFPSDSIVVHKQYFWVCLTLSSSLHFFMRPMWTTDAACSKNSPLFLILAPLTQPYIDTALITNSLFFSIFAWFQSNQKYMLYHPIHLSTLFKNYLFFLHKWLIQVSITIITLFITFFLTQYVWNHFYVVWSLMPKWQ